MLTLSQPTGGVILLEDTTPNEEKSLLELKARKKTTVSAPTPGQQLGSNSGDRNDFASAISGFAPVTPGGFGAGSGGAAAAAGVLNAVDEDDEGGEEAPVPDEFEVESEDDDE
jgi:26S proteasome regulatory subunit N2